MLVLLFVMLLLVCLVCRCCGGVGVSVGSVDGGVGFVPVGVGFGVGVGVGVIVLLPCHQTRSHVRQTPPPPPPHQACAVLSCALRDGRVSRRCFFSLLIVCPSAHSPG